MVNDKGKELIVVTLRHDISTHSETKETARKLKITDRDKIKLILVDRDGKVNGKPWTECLE